MATSSDHVISGWKHWQEKNVPALFRVLCWANDQITLFVCLFFIFSQDHQPLDGGAGQVQVASSGVASWNICRDMTALPFLLSLLADLIGCYSHTVFKIWSCNMIQYTHTRTLVISNTIMTINMMTTKMEMWILTTTGWKFVHYSGFLLSSAWSLESK